MFSFARGNLLVLGSAGTSPAISVRRLGIWQVIKEINKEGRLPATAFWRGLTGLSCFQWEIERFIYIKLVFFQVPDGWIVNCISLSCTVSLKKFITWMPCTGRGNFFLGLASNKTRTPMNQPGFHGMTTILRVIFTGGCYLHPPTSGLLSNPLRFKHHLLGGPDICMLLSTPSWERVLFI